ncbi:MAG TPA: hypothetical protein VJY47_03165 [Candidatus Dojkabacteria bacterium]|nr:hypothetical protein [Candidatus Dojkabacteria bacterium]
MKFVLISALSFLSSATFLLFLLTNPNFSPITTTGGVNYVNFFVLIFLFVISTFSLLFVLFYSIFKFFRKEYSRRDRVIKSLKYSGIVTLGLLIVFLLHFFHILDFIWGLAILVIAIILIFVV